MPSSQQNLLSPSELDYIYNSLVLQPPIRPDGRLPKTFRPLTVETDLLPFTNGSARVCFADGAEGIVGVKAELEKTPHGAEQDERQDTEMDHDNSPSISIPGDPSWIEINIDVSSGLSHRATDEDASAITTFSQMIHEGLVVDGYLPTRLAINQRWHWRIFIDILLISSPPSSFPLPLLSLSTHLALLTSRLPGLISSDDEDPLFNDDWAASTALYAGSPTAQKPPITLLISSIGPNAIFDPSRDELAVSDALVAATIGSTTPANSSTPQISLLSLRTIDPPSRLTNPTNPALGGEKGAFEISSRAADPSSTPEDMGVWKPRRGGVKRDVIAQIIKTVTQPGGVGQEVLKGLDQFCIDSGMSS